jgi:DNA-binding PadR family transcriptional regulator
MIYIYSIYMSRKTEVPSTPLSGAFLDLMPMSGYDIRKFAAREPSPISGTRITWATSIPPAAVSFPRASPSRPTEAGQGKPDRKCTSITERGREELRRRLHLDPQRTNFRHELLLKAFFRPPIYPGSASGNAGGRSGLLQRALADLRAIEPHIEGEIAAGGRTGRKRAYQRMTLRFGAPLLRSVPDGAGKSMEEYE